MGDDLRFEVMPQTKGQQRPTEETAIGMCLRNAAIA